MIEESYVSRETARTLKEAGFDEICRSAYYATGNSAVMYERNSMLSPGYVSRPTQALAERWLREVHNLHVFAFFDYVERNWTYCIADLDAVTADAGMEMSESNYPSYKQAIEACLQEAIKLIKSKNYEEDNVQ